MKHRAYKISRQTETGEKLQLNLAQKKHRGQGQSPEHAGKPLDKIDKLNFFNYFPVISGNNIFFNRQALVHNFASITAVLNTI